MKIAVVFFILFSFCISCKSVDRVDNSALNARTNAENGENSASDKATTYGNFTLNLERVEGGTFSFDDEIKGKKYLVAAFWATWCEPCKIELKKLAELYADFSQRVEFVAISIDAEEMLDKVNEFAVEAALPFPVLVDPSGNVATSLIPGGDGAPYLIIVDKNGVVVSRHSGYAPGDEIALKKELEEFLK